MSLESGHTLFICRPRRVLCALTVDYETWQPLPEGKTIDWDRDILHSTARLLDVFDAQGAVLTIMAEMGEYFWLVENLPAVARRMEEQWRDAVRRGHDVQLHLHPAWLPELGAHHDGDTWRWDPAYARAHDYPGDLGAVIARCKAALESAIRPALPGYRVTSFRAGAYETQPFLRLHDVLVANGIECDSSVLPGDSRPDRHYDYGLAYSTHQPYFAARFDPQLKAPPAERGLVELPAFAIGRRLRWTFDDGEGARFAGRLLAARKREFRTPTIEGLRRRRWLWVGLRHGYDRLRRWHWAVNRLFPHAIAYATTTYASERLVEHEYFVMVAHTKATLDLNAIANGLRRLHNEGIELRSLSELAELARDELTRTSSPDRATEAAYQVRCERNSVLEGHGNREQSRELQRRIPLDRRRVLDLGCGAGAWSAAIARQLPSVEVIGVDVGAEFIAAATRAHSGPRVSFEVADFAELPFEDSAFDCIYADNGLEHAYDVTSTLAEARRVLAPGGLLVAAIPADALDPSRVCDNHTWKTAPHDVRARLEHAGFDAIEIDEVDVYRELGATPYPPSRDTMLYVRAWCPPMPSRARRAAELTRWAYAALDPSRTQSAHDPLAILADGHAWCWGYALVLGEALRREGFEVHWVTMLSDRHPRAIECGCTESHEVLEVLVDGGARHVLDPMAGVAFPCSLGQLLADPARADVPREEDARYRERRYALYSTSAWYRDVERIAVRSRPDARPHFQPAARFALDG